MTVATQRLRWQVPDDRVTEIIRGPTSEAGALATELRDLRAMEQRLLEWADQLEKNRDKPGDVGKFIAAELRNRMAGSLGSLRTSATVTT